MDPPQQLDGALSRGASASTAVAENGFDDLVADREARIKGGHRLLEDHGKPIAAQVASDLFGHVQQIESVEMDRSRHFSRLFRQQAHDRERRDALAASGFADKSQRGALGNREIDGVDRMGGTAIVAMKGDAKIADIDQRRVGHDSFAVAAAMSASIAARSVIPAGFFRLGRNWRKCTQRSRLTASSRASSLKGSVWSSTRRSRSDHSSVP